jgi:CspA family cold shock protein
MTDKISGVVSWFSATKGFGFVKPTDGSEDVFLHATVLQKAGLADLRDGATIICEVMPGRKGRQVTRLLEVDESTASTDDRPPRPMRDGPRSPRQDMGHGDRDEPGLPASGAVKWFNIAKGFGFITPDSGGKDVFLHASVLRRAGLTDLQPGQRVDFTWIDREKGPEARTLSLRDAD